MKIKGKKVDSLRLELEALGINGVIVFDPSVFSVSETEESEALIEFEDSSEIQQLRDILSRMLCYVREKQKFRVYFDEGDEE